VSIPVRYMIAWEEKDTVRKVNYLHHDFKDVFANAFTSDIRSAIILYEY
jgi:hypothetical protein